MLPKGPESGITYGSCKLFALSAPHISCRHKHTLDQRQLVKDAIYRNPKEKPQPHVVKADETTLVLSTIMLRRIIFRVLLSRHSRA